MDLVGKIHVCVSSTIQPEHGEALCSAFGGFCTLVVSHSLISGLLPLEFVGFVG
jgi:hypothetical protein